MAVSPTSTAVSTTSTNRRISIVASMPSSCSSWFSRNSRCTNMIAMEATPNSTLARSTTSCYPFFAMTVSATLLFFRLTRCLRLMALRKVAG